jgi:hypothetical protein
MLGKGNYYSGYYNSGYLTYADAESKASKSGKSKNNQSTRTAHSEKHS